jgi:hypothetical protein
MDNIKLFNNLVDKISLIFIISIHAVIVMFFILTPLTNINYLLFMHSIIVPFIIFHWIVNNNTCVLTLIEHYLREQITGKPVNTNDTFVGKIINPIYDFKNKHSERRIFIYGFAILLWIITVFKLYKKYANGELTDVIDLFIN